MLRTFNVKCNIHLPTANYFLYPEYIEAKMFTYKIHYATIEIKSRIHYSSAAPLSRDIGLITRIPTKAFSSSSPISPSHPFSTRYFINSASSSAKSALFFSGTKKYVKKIPSKPQIAAIMKVQLKTCKIKQELCTE